MAPTAAAMELKVLISIMQQGTALQAMLGQVKQLSQAFTGLQAQAAAATTAGQAQTPPTANAGVLQRVATAAAAAQQATAGATAGVANVGKAAALAAPPTLNLAAAVATLTSGLKFLAGGFLAIQGVRFLKDLADTAARAEVLQTVLHTVAMNSGITAKEIDKVDKQVQSLGITAAASRQSLTQFLQAGLNIKFAPALSRAAQDLAVISGMDSSGTFQRLILNIQQLDTMGLRWMGIVVSRAEAEQRYKNVHKEITGELSQRQKQEALLQETLRKAGDLEGVYLAAMGDVGKQTQSLKRYTDQLSTSVGNFLLPAYSVLVSEFTNFLAKAQITAEVMGETTTIAEDLASAVGTIARALNVAATFLLKHAETILFVVKAYAAWRIAWKIYDLIGGAMNLLAGLRTQILAVTAATQGATVATVAWGAAMAALNTVALTAAIIAMGFALVETAKATRGLWRAIEEGRTIEFFTKKDEDNIIRRMLSLDRASAEEEKIINARLSKNTALRAAGRQQMEAQDALSQAERDYATARKGGIQADKDATEAKYAVARADMKAAKEAVAAAEARFAIEDPEGFRREKAEAAQRAEVQRIKKHGEEMIAASAELGEKVTFTDENKALPVAFQKTLSTVSKFVADFDEISKKPADATGRIKEALDSLGDLPRSVAQIQESLKIVVPTVTNAEALKQFDAQVGEIRKRYAAAGADPQKFAELNRLQALARLNAAAGERALFAPLDAERAARLKEEQSRYADHLQSLLTMTKSRNETQASIDKDQYDQGLMTLDAYFEARLVRMREEAGLEQQIAINNLRSLEQQKAAGLAKTDPERQALRSQLEAAQRRLKELQGDEKTPSAFAKAQADLLRQQDAERRGISRQILELELQTAAAYGSEAEAIAVINQQALVRKEAMKGVAGGDEAVDADTQLRLEQNAANFRQLALERALEANVARRQALTIEQAILDVEKGRVDADAKVGAITDLEAMRLRNRLLMKQVDIDRKELAILEVELAAKNLEIQNTILRVNEEQAKAGKAADDPATIDKRRAAIEGLQSETAQLSVQVVNLNGKIQTATAEMETYGASLKRNFTDGFADALVKTTHGFEEAGKAWVSFAKSIADEITSIFAKALTQKLFSKLSFGFMDSLMGTSGGGGGGGNALFGNVATPTLAEGGMITGPGTGTSDSVIARVSAGEHIMPAAKTAQFLPLLEGIRTGRILPYRTGGLVHSIAPGSIIPRRYASGGMVATDGGASSVQPGGGGPGNMVVTMHPDTLNMTMREWLEHEVVRQQGRR
jgi:hypothetical protein